MTSVNGDPGYDIPEEDDWRCGLPGCECKNYATFEAYWDSFDAPPNQS